MLAETCSFYHVVIKHIVVLLTVITLPINCRLDDNKIGFNRISSVLDLLIGSSG